MPNHASVDEVSGLDRFKRFSGALTVGGKDLAATQTWERSREARVLYARAPVLDADLRGSRWPQAG